MRFKEASYYKKLSDKKVHCKLCPHKCIVGNGETGKCRVKQNVNGRLKSMNYGKIYLSQQRNIEDVGFFHFMPGSESVLISSVGNNLEGEWYADELSGKDIENIPVVNQSSIKIGGEMAKKKINILCYGEQEPMMSYEYIEDIVNNNNLKHLVITNGFVENEPLRELVKKIDGAIIEIRGMTPDFYENVLSGKIEPVLNSAKVVNEEKKWLEIYMPLIPEIHYSLYDVRKIISWTLDNLGSDVPLHFIPKNFLDESLLKKARKIAIDAGINYAYAHVPNWEEGKTTFCSGCKRKLIVRNDKGIIENKLINGKCQCGKSIAGIWE